MKYILSFLFIFFTLTCHATVYQQTDSSGTTVYSDEPLENNAQPVETDSTTVNQISSPSSASVPSALPASSATAINSPANHEAYTTFTIINPKDQETFQNQVSIGIEIKLHPKLQAGDRLQLYVDGKPWQMPTRAPSEEQIQLELVQLERGTHEIHAVILNEVNNISQQSNSITIFVHHASVNSIKANTHTP